MRISNNHLEPVFKVLLFGLKKAGIDYWVYGGVSIAGYAGKFIRENNDVDIFVREKDFNNTRLILDYLCKQNNFELINQKLLRNGRPKLDIKIAGKERLSVIPIYLKDTMVEFKFWKRSEEYPYQILEKMENNISGYKFFTPPNEYIRKLFLNYLISRKDKKNNPKIKDYDAKAILTLKEYTEQYLA